jgi:signal transduction histidine kinase
MQGSHAMPLILSIGDSNIPQSALENWRDLEHQTNFRSIKKIFHSKKPALVVACIKDESDEQLSKKVTQYIRDGLANHDTRIVLLHEPSFDIDLVNWMEKLQVNACLSTSEQKQSFNISMLNREIDTFLHIDNNRRQHDAESQMLMCISQFSRTNESLSDLLKSFSSTLAMLCHSACSFHIAIKDNQEGEIDFCDQQNIQQIVHQTLGLPKIPEYIQHTIDEKSPQINLLTDTTDLSAIEDQLDIKIGSYLSFPIVTYDKVLYLLVYLIPEDKMDKVSMKQINVINKACEQLTMLLERRQAEDSLKKQYQRLKNALVELKTTKEELQQKEKMASIGQMAAGIAHEINNPLSFVISNFSSMDHYVESIIKLQELQGEFLSSIESGQDQKINSLKDNIFKFEEEKDIDFILEDIRAVVSDSHAGLQRVKNIITDLKSFTHNQATELEICDLNKVINETLGILSYDLKDKVTVQTDIDEIPEFKAHNGLMQQVLTNLIKNAQQAMEEAQTQEPTIHISVKLEAAMITLRVRDNGPGISDKAKNKIFEPFFTTKAVGTGTGLGLSVTFNIIKKLGGTISFETKTQNKSPTETPNSSFTEFIICFPCNKEVH